MPTIMFQRIGWSLHISRSSRQFSVLVATGLPRHTYPPRLHDPINTPGASVRASSRDASQPASALQSIPKPPARLFSTANAFRQESAAAPQQPKPSDLADLSAGLNDEPLVLDEGAKQVDWARSFHGLSAAPFPKEAADVLTAPVNADDVEVKPDGIVYLPEIKYRRILNKAFGPGAWGLAPRGETIVTPKAVTREYALVVMGRLVSVARGEQDYFSPDGIPTAAEGCKSNALMRCCKDLGVASELWDPHWIRSFSKERVREVWVEHAVTKKRRKMSLLKGRDPPPPFKETR